MDIKTIFYFVNNLSYEDYRLKWEAKEIANRTIIFSRENRSIFAHGVQYSPMTPEQLKEIIQNLLDNGDLVLPVASEKVRGVIRIGEGLSMGEDDNYDVLSVDFSKVTNTDDLLTLIRALFDSAEILRATKGQFGIVKLGDGLSIGSEGQLNVDFADIPNNADVYAYYDRYGVVKIKPEGGITVTRDGIISVDSSKFPDNMKGDPGENGKSAYQIAVDNGFEGSVDDWLASLKGDTGDRGPEGQPGKDGKDGRNGTNGTNGKIEVGREQYWLASQLSSGVTIDSFGWTRETQIDQLNENKKYLWTYFKVYWNIGDPTYIGPYIASVFSKGEKGDKGDKGDPGQNGADAVVDLNELKTTIINNIKTDINTENNWWNSWAENLLNEAWRDLLNALKNNWNDILYSSGWDTALKAYIQNVELVNINQSPTAITISDAFTQLIQEVNRLTGLVQNITGFFDPDTGDPVSLSTAISQMIAGVTNDSAFRQDVQAYVEQVMQTGTISSAITSLQSFAGKVEQELTATNKLVARVDNGSNVTLNLLKQLSDGNKAVTSLSSSYDIYEMENGNYKYATENGNWVYDIDEQGRAIPWKAIKLFYIDKDSGQEISVNESNKSRARYKKNRVWDDTENDWVEEIAYEDPETKTKPLYDMVGEMVYFERDINTGDLPKLNDDESYSYIFERDLTHDGNGELVWSGIGTNTDPKKLSNPNIAYHRARVRKTISLADLQLGANADHAWNFLSAMYEGFGDVQNIASTTQVANAKGAVIETMARHTCYIPKIDGNGNVEKDQDGNVLYRWEKIDSNGNIITDGGNAVIAWSSSDNGPQLEGTWRKSIKQDVMAGMTAVATSYFAQTGIQSVIDDVSAYMGTCVTYDENTHTYTSSAKISADNIILDGTTFIQRLFADSAAVSKRLVVGEVGQTGIVIHPISGGYGVFNMGVLSQNAETGVVTTSGASIDGSNNTSGLTIAPEAAGDTGGVTLTIRTGEGWTKIHGGDIEIYKGNDTSASNLALKMVAGTNGYEITTYGINNGAVNQNVYTRIAPGYIQLSDGSSYRTITTTSGS